MAPLSKGENLGPSMWMATNAQSTSGRTPSREGSRYNFKHSAQNNTGSPDTHPVQSFPPPHSSSPISPDPSLENISPLALELTIQKYSQLPTTHPLGLSWHQRPGCSSQTRPRRYSEPAAGTEREHQHQGLPPRRDLACHSQHKQ
jgi:hypothetical protein